MTMLSTLIRYTSSKYADSILKGDLYLPSLSAFWDLRKGKIRCDAVESGRVTEEDLRQAITYTQLKQQDYSEGIAVQLPHDVLDKIAPEVSQYAIHDTRFRIEAYGYCNLLCFYRVDAGEEANGLPLDAGIITLLAKEKGIAGINSFEDFVNLPPREKARTVKAVSETNLLLDPKRVYLVHLPPETMDGFGDLVIVVKDEEQFIDRVLEAVRRQGGECITGDVRYHRLQDRMNPHHSMSLVSDQTLDMKALLADSNDSIRYGSLDKYEKYSDQKEWRICWLPKEHNFEGKTLHIGDISDIVDLVDAKDVRRYLLKRYKGYFPGILSERRRSSKGTVSYQTFKKYVENIDGKCRILFDIG